MTASDELISRIRGEYIEMPGLRLTFAQACRFWQVNATNCTAVLGALVAQGFLQQTPDGAYVAFPGRPRTPAKATLRAPFAGHAPALRRA